MLFDASHYVYAPQNLLSYVRTLLPSNGHAPSLSHRFIRLLEEKGQLLRNYTQNVDALERAAGIKAVLPCHGSLAKVSCLACKHVLDPAAFAAMLDSAFASAAASGEKFAAPRCNGCEHELNLFKPEIAFLNEACYATEAEQMLRADLASADLVVVLGATLASEPLKSLPVAVHPSVPQIVIGPAPPPALGTHEWDLQLLGPCDTVVGYLASALGWSLSDGAPTPSEPELVSPTCFRFQAAAAHTNGAADGASADEGAGSLAAAVSEIYGLPPPQTPLATYPPPMPGGGTKKKSLLRGYEGFSGATLYGSGIGARSTLGRSAGPQNLASKSAAVGGAEDEPMASGAVKRPAEESEEPPPTKH